MTLDQLRARYRELKLNLEMLAAVDGDLDEGQRKQWNEDTAEIRTIGTEIEDRATRAQVWADLRASALGDEPATRGEVTGGQPTLVTVTGDGAAAAGINRDIHLNKGLAGAEIYDRSGLNVRDERDANAWHNRAMRAIEDWNRTIPEDYRDSARALVANVGGSQRDRDVAEHILKLGSPEYVRAFYKYLSAPQRLGTDAEMQRALSEGTTTAGGFMVPPFLDPAIILTNAGISNPFRGISTIKTITTQTWKGVTSAGVTAEWTAEAAEMTDASPTLLQPSISPVRADAYIQASFEMLDDTDIASELAMLFADARDRLEGAAFATGTGSTQPTGIVTSLNVTTNSKVATSTNGAFGAIDVFALDNSLPQRWRANASWLSNKSIYNLVRQFAIGTGALIGSFWVDFGGARPSSLIGYPVYESSAMLSSLSAATASVDNIMVVGDFRQFYIVDRIGMSVAYNPMVLGSNRRPTGEVGWAAWWRVGAQTVNADAFRVLQA